MKERERELGSGGLRPCRRRWWRSGGVEEWGSGGVGGRGQQRPIKLDDPDAKLSLKLELGLKAVYQIFKRCHAT